MRRSTHERVPELSRLSGSWRRMARPSLGLRHTPPGSSVTFVELSDNKGWVVESAADGTVLERAADGKAVVENVTGG